MSPPKGHRNLAVRSGTSFCQGFLTLTLALYNIDPAHAYPTSFFEFCAAATLFVQWRTADPKMFLLRALCSWARAIISAHAAGCGRRWPWEDCSTAGWYDIRLPLRICHCLASLRMVFNGLSLYLQYKFPKRGVGIRGNEQLFYRGCIQATGVPLHLCRAMIKIGQLSGTEYQRLPVEVGINFIRAFSTIPIASWSLMNQWMTTGTGRRTDDVRTNMKGRLVSQMSPDTFADYLEPHKGERDLLIRAAAVYLKSFFTLWLLFYWIDPAHTLPILFCQLLQATLLLLQWRTGRRIMWLIRSIGSFVRGLVLVHLSACGRVWYWEGCDTSAWHDFRIVNARILLLGSARQFLNGISLALHYKFPERGVTEKHGNEQLFLRGWLRFLGVPLHLTRAMHKLTELPLTKFEVLPIEITVQFLYAIVCIPIETLSLFHQWRFTGRAEGRRASKQISELAAELKKLQEMNAELQARQSSSSSLDAIGITDSKEETCMLYDGTEAENGSTTLNDENGTSPEAATSPSFTIDEEEVLKERKEGELQAPRVSTRRPSDIQF
eukprot:TRINITY_DN5922_c0_g1_i1.p1 TRINITY_DN5922_c0_g1~~TRINITY_DN5922_c0_g1_i1.p1  ORF type:complete len:551 (-),score=63.01 TRINITY_DN5922_c0_g1_i1:27-1679(-)